MYVNGLVAVMRLGGVSTGGLKATQIISREIPSVLRNNGVSSSAMKVRLRFVQKALGVLHDRLPAASGRLFPVPRDNEVS